MEASIAGNVATSVWTEPQLRHLNRLFRDRTPQALLNWATVYFGQKIVLTCSFGGASGMVLLDMVARLGRATPVIFLDTGLLFPETYALAEAAARRYGVRIERRTAALTLEEQDRQEGARLYARDPDRCCGIRKVAPLAEVLRPYRGWISGIRRDQSASRAETALLQWNSRHQVVKINPLAFWTDRQVWAYINANDVPYNPLLDQGYASLGCAPCTRPAAAADSRAGRWAGFAKIECGIHL